MELLEIYKYKSVIQWILLFCPTCTGDINLTSVVMNSNSTVVSILRFSTVRSDYSGSYTCLGFNSHNYSYISVNLVIGELPGKKKGRKGTNVSWDVEATEAAGVMLRHGDNV